MYKGGLKSRGRGFKHPLSMENLRQPWTEDELKSLVMDFLEKGNEESKTLIIEGHIRLAMSIAARYIDHFPSKTDDIVSEALLAVTESVVLAPGRLGPPFNISGWITRSIHNRISNFLCRDFVVRIPNWIIKKGGYKYTMQELDVNIVNKNEVIMQKLKERLHTMILEAKLTDLENLIISKLLMGYKEKEIADEMKVSQQYVNRLYHLALEKLKCTV